jgi:DtxR family Mn-dependent transcriptional regulator
MRMLSQAVEDYVKVIYRLQEDDQGKGVSTTRISDAMQVAPASVTSMVKRLAGMGLLDYNSHRGVILTHAGEKVALEIIRHHRLIELYLSEVLGYSWDEVHDEAEHLEHHISEQFEERIFELLGRPTHDPHGDPIPTKDGIMPESFDTPLSEIDAGMKVWVRRVSDRDPELLRYLSEIGLIPGTEVNLTSKGPFKGPIHLELDNKELVIGFEVADRVFVSHD